MLYPYPLEIPTQEITSLVIAALRRQDVNVKDAAHAAWQVAGYALSQWDLGPISRGPATISDAEAADILEGKTVVSGSAASGIPWDLLLPVLLRLLERLLLPPTPTP